MSFTSEIVAIDGKPLCPEAVRMLEYLRARAAALSDTGIRERIRAAAQELESAVAPVEESQSRLRPFPDKWNIAEVVDHIGQTQIRAAEELRHLLAGRRPPAPPVYEALRSGAAVWAPWPALIEGLHSANHELLALLEAPPAVDPNNAPTARTVLVVNGTLSDGRVAPQLFIAELGWREYALVQRLHLLDHRTQVKKLREALAK